MFKRSLSTLLATALLLSPLASVQASDDGVAILKGITRKSGGQVYRLDLQEPLRLERVSILILSAKLKVHSARLVTESQTRISLANLTNTAVTAAGQTLKSEYINRNDRIAALEIRAESFGAVADIIVTATSDEGLPVLIDEDSSSAPPPYNPPYEPSPEPPPYYPPTPTPTPAPTPPEVIQLSYPFDSYGPREYSKVECTASDDGWEEHWGGHSTCEACMAKHGDCVERCDLEYVRVFGIGVDMYGRIGKFEGRAPDSWSAKLDMQRVCDYYRLGSCEEDPSKSQSNFSETISRRECRRH
ncbi:beta-sandwich domain-containing protein [Bdellovibrio sp. HCB337]|uniref:beta-sandwich domain-containing protein n=1 Tax=Bdellovibrio sp. HCB337 TaxID=3394358 RepID=UPI0039A6B3CE